MSAALIIFNFFNNNVSDIFMNTDKIFSVREVYKDKLEETNKPKYGNGFDDYNHIDTREGR